MTDWDQDGPTLHENLLRVLHQARDDALCRAAPSLATMKRWHAEMLDGLDVPEPIYVGRFRGEHGEPLLAVDVRVGNDLGVPFELVAEAAGGYGERLTRAVGFLDGRVAPGELPGEDDLGAVVALCAWAHAEWVRIHPFANGNGRTARLWANWIAMRYGLPPFVRLRPRPHGASYALAAQLAMRGQWRPTIQVFEGMLRDLVE